MLHEGVSMQHHSFRFPNGLACSFTMNESDATAMQQRLLFTPFLIIFSIKNFITISNGTLFYISLTYTKM